MVPCDVLDPPPPPADGAARRRTLRQRGGGPAAVGVNVMLIAQFVSVDTLGPHRLAAVKSPVVVMLFMVILVVGEELVN